MNYPLISEYIESIKLAEDNFEELSYLRPVLDTDGQPVMSSGNFAVVFKMKDERDGKLYAVRCFHRDQEGRAECYRLIEEGLKDVESPYLVSFRYMDKELFVDSSQTDETEFPVLLMDWVEGITLDKYLRENLDDQYALEMLAYRFSQLAQWLIPQPFAHGDLKPDNILVREDGNLVLVDYDGMYVPAMKGQKARELGSPDFRHPLRTEDDFDEHIDDFPLVSILLSLKAISINPSWLEKYGAADRLLLSYYEFHDIRNCKFITECFPCGDKSADMLYTLFLEVYYTNFMPPLFERLLQFSKPIALIPYNIINKEKKSLYDRINNKLLALQYKYINFVDPTLQSSTSCIMSNNYGEWGLIGYTNAAIVSCPKDINNIIWYKRVSNIGKSRNRFIVVDSLDRHGIVDDCNNILLDFVFQEIEAIDIGDDIYLKCKKLNYYCLLNKDLNVIIPLILREMKDYPWLKIITYKNDQGHTFAMDLCSLKECRLPSDFNTIEDYKDGIFTFETSERQYKFFSFEKQRYISDYVYQRVSRYEKLKVHKSYILCKKGESVVLLSIDGEEISIDLQGRFSQYGETVIAVNPIEVKYKGRYNNELTRYDFGVVVFKKGVLYSRFTYNDGSGYYWEKYELINEDVIKVWMPGISESYIDLKGERIPSPSNIRNKETRETAQKIESWLVKLVTRKYLNSDYIQDYDQYEIDNYNFFIVEPVGDIAYVRYFWAAGDDEGTCGYVDIGYADERVCYWGKD